MSGSSASAQGRMSLLLRLADDTCRAVMRSHPLDTNGNTCPVVVVKRWIVNRLENACTATRLLDGSRDGDAFTRVAFLHTCRTGSMRVGELASGQFTTTSSGKRGKRGTKKCRTTNATRGTGTDGDGWSRSGRSGWVGGDLAALGVWRPVAGRPVTHAGRSVQRCGSTGDHEIVRTICPHSSHLAQLAVR
jgi:hypothetical protein